MKRGVLLVAACAIIVGCFGRPATVTPVQGKEETKTASPVAAQETLNPISKPENSQSPVATLASPTPVPVVAKDPEMKIGNIRVGDPALESSVEFSVDRVGTVTVGPQSTEGLRLFKVVDDQYGQTELIGNINGVVAEIPAVGTFKVVGKEKPLPFMDVPLGGEASQAQYRVQKIERNCPAIPIPEKKLVWGGYTSPKVGTGRLTVDTEYPARVTVYLHRGAGNSDNPVDSFQNWVDYNLGHSPDRVALAQRVRAYVHDPWDSGPSPHLAARKYNEDRTSCGVQGESWVDVCHSAGCQKVWRAYLDQPTFYDQNNRGIIASSPVLGGSHWSIDDLTYASLAANYEEKAAHWAVVRTLVQWEWGMLPLPSVQKILLRNILAGSRLSLYNEGARALAWNGIGAGIPTTSYKWYSNIFFERGRYLSRLLKPESRFTFPIGGDLGNMAPAQYTHAGEPSPMFNYIEAMGAAELAQSRQYYKSPEMARGKMDVAVCYLNDSTSSQQAKIAAFEKEYGETSKREMIWKNLVDPGYKRAFAKAALPWMNAVIAKSPAVVSHNPLPNESAANDGALTIAQQLGLRDGQSILAPGSKYGALIINRSAIDARLPDIVGGYELFGGCDHYDAVEGCRNQQWDWMNGRLIARVDAMREEEKTFVLMDAVKREILDMLGPPGGDFDEPTEWDGTRHRRIANYVLYASSVKWTQDPLNTGQRNRIRVVGTGKLATYVGWWSDIYNAYDYDPKQWDDTRYATWNVDEQFVIRRGEPRLVAN